VIALFHRCRAVVDGGVTTMALDNNATAGPPSIDNSGYAATREQAMADFKAQ
jgi:hypothetical protein